jgi:hypothetical protein
LHPRVIETSDIPIKFLGHPFFETARFICGDEPFWDFDLRWEEAMGDVVLALVEGRDPDAAYRTCDDRDRIWYSRNLPLYGYVDVDEDHHVVYGVRDD